MHLFKVPFSLGPVLFTKETGSVPEIEEFFFSVDFICFHEIVIENSSQNIYRIVFIIFDWADPVKNHSSISQTFHGVQAV